MIMERKAVCILSITFILLTFGFHFAIAQAKGDDLSNLREKIRKTYGSNLPPVPVPINNPQGPKKLRLGEALFFDPNLSSCGDIACASCHMPEKGFSDGQQISDGCQGASGRRNSNTVYQTAYLSHLFWDGRVQSLEQQALGPVVDAAEMSNTWDNVIAYLKSGTHPVTKKDFPEANKFYSAYFNSVFGGVIDSTTVTKAIAAYERTVSSYDSPYDRWLKGNDKALTAAQKKGLQIFFGRGNCASCHTPPNFSDSDFHNLGIPNAGFEAPALFPYNAEICRGVPADIDPGRAEVPFLRSSCSDLGKFKTPTLRNIEYSAPYMHNGVFATLDAVLEHLNKLSEGLVTPRVGNLDRLVTKGNLRFGRNVDTEDIQNVKEFLRALSGKQLQSPPSGIKPPRL